MRSDDNDNNLLVGRRKEGQMTIVLRGHTKVLICTLTSIEKALGTQLSRMLADETMSESFMVVYGAEVMNSNDK